MEKAIELVVFTIPEGYFTVRYNVPIAIAIAIASPMSKPWLSRCAVCPPQGTVLPMP